MAFISFFGETNYTNFGASFLIKTVKLQFFNKAKDKVKMLWWHANGFTLYYKRLEKHRFILPRNIAETVEITQAQLHGLLAGLDFSLMRHFPEINYHQYA